MDRKLLLTAFKALTINREHCHTIFVGASNQKLCLTNAGCHIVFNNTHLETDKSYEILSRPICKYLESLKNADIQVDVDADGLRIHENLFKWEDEIPMVDLKFVDGFKVDIKDFPLFMKSLKYAFERAPLDDSRDYLNGVCMNFIAGLPEAQLVVTNGHYLAHSKHTLNRSYSSADLLDLVKTDAVRYSDSPTTDVIIPASRTMTDMLKVGKWESLTVWKNYVVLHQAAVDLIVHTINKKYVDYMRFTHSYKRYNSTFSAPLKFVDGFIKKVMAQKKLYDDGGFHFASAGISIIVDILDGDNRRLTLQVYPRNVIDDLTPELLLCESLDIESDCEAYNNTFNAFYLRDCFKMFNVETVFFNAYAKGGIKAELVMFDSKDSPRNFALVMPVST